MHCDITVVARQALIQGFASIFPTGYAIVSVFRCRLGDVIVATCLVDAAAFGTGKTRTKRIQTI